MNTTFTQHFTGAVQVYAVPNTPHCGLTSGRITLGIDVDLSYCGQALDSNGFLLDNTWFNEYVKSMTNMHINYSCELLAQTIASHVCQDAGQRGCSAKVTVRPFSGACITCTLTRLADKALEYALAPSVAETIASQRQDILAGYK